MLYLLVVLYLHPEFIWWLDYWMAYWIGVVVTTAVTVITFYLVDKYC
jgi:hypothetical protein